MKFHLVKSSLTAIENDQLRTLQFVKDQLPHVLIVLEKSPRIGKHHLLVRHPFFGHVLIEGIQIPHAVILHDNPLNLMF